MAVICVLSPLAAPPTTAVLPDLTSLLYYHIKKIFWQLYILPDTMLLKFFIQYKGTSENAAKNRLK